MEIESFESGDLLLFSGKTSYSKIIQLFTRSIYSHVAMVAKKPDGIYCAESDDSTFVNNGVSSDGVRLTLLSEKIKNYDGNVYFRSASKVKKDSNLFVDEEDFNRRFFEVIQEFYGVPYEKNLLELFNSAYDGPLGENKEDLSSLFCSEFVAETYKRLGLIKDLETPSNEYTPADFSKQLHWNKFADFGEIVQIK